MTSKNGPTAVIGIGGILRSRSLLNPILDSSGCRDLVYRPLMEENFEEDWQILRRKSIDRIPTTMHVGEALSRLSSALWTFLAVEEDNDRGFFLAIEQQRQNDSYTKLKFRVAIRGFKDKENVTLFESVNQLPFCEELEEAVEQTFAEVRAILLRFNQERKVHVEAAQAEVHQAKEILMKLERNVLEMGHLDLKQMPLPFSS